MRETPPALPQLGKVMSVATPTARRFNFNSFSLCCINIMYFFLCKMFEIFSQLAKNVKHLFEKCIVFA